MNVREMQLTTKKSSNNGIRLDTYLNNNSENRSVSSFKKILIGLGLVMTSYTALSDQVIFSQYDGVNTWTNVTLEIEDAWSFAQANPGVAFALPTAHIETQEQEEIEAVEGVEAVEGIEAVDAIEAVEGVEAVEGQEYIAPTYKDGETVLTEATKETRTFDRTGINNQGNREEWTLTFTHIEGDKWFNPRFKGGVVQTENFMENVWVTKFKNTQKRTQVKTSTTPAKDTTYVQVIDNPGQPFIQAVVGVEAVEGRPAVIGRDAVEGVEAVEGQARVVGSVEQAMLPRAIVAVNNWINTGDAKADMTTLVQEMFINYAEFTQYPTAMNGNKVYQQSLIATSTKVGGR